MFCMCIFKFNLVYRVIFYGWKYVYLDFCFHLIVYILYNIYMNINIIISLEQEYFFIWISIFIGRCLLDVEIFIE